MSSETTEDLPQCPRCGLAEAWRGDASGKCVDCGWPDAQSLVTPDPRDAEIERLKAQIEKDNEVILSVREQNRRLRRALAAGPMAVRLVASLGERVATIVEAAQAEAMKEDGDGK